MYLRKCVKIDCEHISYSKSTYYRHRQKCKVAMNYKEHEGYVHFQKIEKNKNKGKTFVQNYYSTLEEDEKETLRGCLALFHKEVHIQKKKYEELMKLGQVMESAIETMNLTKSISSEDDDSPRAKRAREREQQQQQVFSNGWSVFGRTSASSSSNSNA